MCVCVCMCLCVCVCVYTHTVKAKEFHLYFIQNFKTILKVAYHLSAGAVQYAEYTSVERYDASPCYHNESTC